MRVAAFLRAVNVGKANRVPMAELVRRLTEAGLRDVASFRLSGNILATADDADHLQWTTESILADAFGIQTPVVTRNAEQLARLAEAWPFPDQPDEVRDLLYLFRPDGDERPAEAVTTADPSLLVGALTPQDAYARVPLVDGGALYADRLIRVPKAVLTVRTWAVVRDVMCRL